MEYMRKWVSMLTAFSLAVSLLTAVPARATELTSQLGSESIVDPQGDAAALGDTDEEEGTASGGEGEESEEEQDVMATVTGEVTAEPSEDTTADGGDTTTSAETDTGDVAATEETDGGEAVTTEEANDGTANESSEEEQAAEGETPEEEETASSGVKEEESEGQDAPEESELPFEDVPANHWSYPYVLYAYEHDLVRGVSETAFNPTGVMTRAAFVTVLYRLSAKLEADMSAGEVAFTDIGDINEEFQSAIRWAAAHGIVTGKSEEIFAPRENVTRQQMCAILTRYLRDYLNYDLSAYAGDTVFADNDAISTYAKEAVSIAQKMGIISGREVDGVTIFDPAGSASRAAVVKVLSIAVQQMPDLTKRQEPSPADTGESTDTGESADTGNSTDTGDSADTGNSTDTGDTSKDTNSGSSSGGGGGSSSGGSGGSTGGSGGSSGGSGDTSGSGGSTGGDSGNSGEDSGNTTKIHPDEPPNAPQIFKNLDTLLANYEKNPPQDEFVKSCMDILIPDLKALVAARNAGELVDAAYVKAHFNDDMTTLLKKYDAATASDVLRVMEYIQSLGGSRTEVMEILDYFGIMEYIFG